ncbi:MAG: DUF1801 domain-containing protein [Aggregatilineales bacterium]
MANKKKVDNEAAVLEKIATMPEPYNMIGKRLHEIITEAVPDLNPRLWYGAPGYAKEGPVLCFFRVDDYMTFGLTEKANFTVEDGAPDQLMACAWFLTSLDDSTEQRIAEIVRKATD